MVLKVMTENTDIKGELPQPSMPEISDVMRDGTMFGARIDKYGRITVPEDVRLKQKISDGDWLIVVCKKMK